MRGQSFVLSILYLPLAGLCSRIYDFKSSNIPKQGYRGGGDAPSILRGFCDPHLGYGGLVGHDNIASLKYLIRFGRPGN